MGVVIVRQPNGKLASFSTEFDAFVAWDMTQEEAYEYCREYLDLGRADSQSKVDAGLQDHKPMTIIPGDGLDRWRYSLEAFAMRHTEDDLKALLKHLGFPDYDYSSAVTEFADPEYAEPYTPGVP